MCFRFELLGCTRIDCMAPYCDDATCSTELLVPDAARNNFEANARLIQPRAVCQADFYLPDGEHVVYILGGFDEIVDISDNSGGTMMIIDLENDDYISYDFSDIPLVVITKSPRLSVRILSGLMTLPAMVTASYGFVDKPGCSSQDGSDIQICTQPTGIVLSPNYFNSYPENIDITWLLNARPWNEVDIRFVYFDVTALDAECAQDFVLVTDPSTGSTIGRYCSENPPPSGVGSIVSSLNRMQIDFHSNHFESASGFLGEYVSIPQVPDTLLGSDTEGFSCPEGWDYFRRSCYQLFSSPDPITWNEAEIECTLTRKNSHLVSIRDKDEMFFLHYMVASEWETVNSKTYLGLGHRSARGFLHWNDGSPMSYADWYYPESDSGESRQPDGGVLEACTMLVFDLSNSEDLSTDLWHDVACASPETNQFVCETPATDEFGNSPETTLPTSDWEPQSGCMVGSFECSSGECINSVYVCDGMFDCQDSSDEWTCTEGCDVNQFMCADGSCISISFFCDSIFHCLDNSDERDCNYPQCTDDQFSCTSGQCVDLAHRCDFIPQCDDSTDEEGCDLVVSSWAFQCYDGSLFPGKMQCDGMVDCIGNTKEDEETCAYSKSTGTCRAGEEITCNDGACAPATSRCMYSLDEYDLHEGCRDVTHLRDCGNFTCPPYTVKCRDSYCIPLRYHCDGKNDCPQGEDETQCVDMSCPDGSYRCKAQTFCISPSHVCDDVVHCPERDDEMFCDACPDGCLCVGMSYECNATDFTLAMPRELRQLSLTCESLETCNTSLVIAEPGKSNATSNVTYVPSDTPYIAYLNMGTSGVRAIEPFSFKDNANILLLGLAGNRIRELTRSTFTGLRRMRQLNLSMNPIESIEEGTFANFSDLQELDLRDTNIEVSATSNLGIFNGLHSLQTLYADKYLFCCLAGLGDSPGCNAPHDQFSSCEDLMANTVLRISIWLLGGSAFVGNAFVVVYRLATFRREKRTRVQNTFITSLAISDFMMGLYMMTIAAADTYYRGNYAINADAWQSSALCKLAGIISVVASEASVFLIMMISWDRCVHIVAPFKRGIHLTQVTAIISVILVWLLAVFAGVLPLLIPAYSDANFYGQSGVCLALPLTVDRPPGWHYSISLFIGVNFFGFLVTLLCYVAIYVSIQVSRRELKGGSSKDSQEEGRRKEDIKMAAKMALIVGTDLICWLPIIVMGLMAAAGKLSISAEVYAWTAVFVLPVNSSLNPYLYTFSTLLEKKKRASKQDKSEDQHTKESIIFEGSVTSIITSYSSIPEPAPEKLGDWLAANDRDLTRPELNVISRDIDTATESLQEAELAPDLFLTWRNIAVQTNGSGRIERAFLSLDSSLTAKRYMQNMENEGDNGSSKNVSELHRIIQQAKKKCELAAR